MAHIRYQIKVPEQYSRTKGEMSILPLLMVFIP